MTAPAVHGAICAVMSDLAKEGIEKGRRNEQQGYKFRGIEDVYNALCGLLAKHQLTMLPHELLNVSRDTRETAKGGVLYVTYITVRWKFTSAVDGSCDYAVSLGEAMDSADKSSNKSMSAAYKYAAVQCFCIPTEGEDDADSTTPEPSRPRTLQPPPQQQRQAAPPAQQPPSRGHYDRVWPLYSNSSVVGKPLSEVPTEKLTSYIARLEKSLKDKDEEIKVSAQYYYKAALAEFDKRDKSEAPKSGDRAS